MRPAPRGTSAFVFLVATCLVLAGWPRALSPDPSDGSDDGLGVFSADEVQLRLPPGWRAMVRGGRLHLVRESADPLRGTLIVDERPGRAPEGDGAAPPASFTRP